MPKSIKDKVAIVGMGCTKFGTLWDKGPTDLIVEAVNEACQDAGGFFRYGYDDNNCIIGGECDTCQLDYEEALDNYSWRVFVIALIIGIITFIVGFAVLKVEPVGSALL